MPRRPPPLSPMGDSGGDEERRRLRAHAHARARRAARVARHALRTEVLPAMKQDLVRAHAARIFWSVRFPGVMERTI